MAVSSGVSASFEANHEAASAVRPLFGLTSLTLVGKKTELAKWLSKIDKDRVPVSKSRVLTCAPVTKEAV